MATRCGTPVRGSPPPHGVTAMTWSTTRSRSQTQPPGCLPCLAGTTYSRQAAHEIAAETSLLQVYECPDGQGWHLTSHEGTGPHYPGRGDHRAARRLGPPLKRSPDGTRP